VTPLDSRRRAWLRGWLALVAVGWSGSIPAAVLIAPAAAAVWWLGVFAGALAIAWVLRGVRS
jgi:hypothetical protein